MAVRERKQILVPGQYTVEQTDPDGNPYQLRVEFTAEDCRRFADTGNRMIGHGFCVPAPLGHQSKAGPVPWEQAEALRLAYNTGAWKRFEHDPKDGSLWGEVEVDWLPGAKSDDDIRRALRQRLKYVSGEFFPELTLGDGSRWQHAIRHVCLTNQPVWLKQPAFGEGARLALAPRLTRGRAAGFTQPLRLSLFTRQGWVIDLAAKHAPKGGITVNGKHYPGGRFIPGSELAKDKAAAAKVDAARAEAQSRRKATGDVDKHNLRTRAAAAAKQVGGLQGALKGKREYADRAWASLVDHHGELAHHRVRELMEKDLTRLEAGKLSPADKTLLQGRLACYAYWLNKEAKGKGEGGALGRDVGEKPVAAADTLGGETHVGTLKDIDNGTAILEKPNGKEQAVQLEALRPAEPGEVNDAAKEAGKPASNYYVRNQESGKLELHFDKATYSALPPDVKSRIKRTFQWSPSRSAWVSRSTNNHYFAEEIAKELKLEDAGKEGEKLSFREQMERKVERAEGRADRMEGRAAGAKAEADRRFNSANVQAVIGLQGEPVKVGHHSEKRHRRLLEKADADMGKGVQAWEKSQHYEQRAEAARRTASQQQLQNPAYLDNRIKENEAEMRSLRRLAEQNQDKPDYLDRLEERASEVSDRLAFFQEHMQKAGGVKYGKENVKTGDRVLTDVGWAVVNRANPTTVSVTIDEGGAKGMTAKYPYARIKKHEPQGGGETPPLSAPSREELEGKTPSLNTRKIRQDINVDGSSKLPDGRVVELDSDFDSNNGGYRYKVTSPNGGVAYTPFHPSVGRLEDSGELRRLLNKPVPTSEFPPPAPAGAVPVAPPAPAEPPTPAGTPEADKLPAGVRQRVQIAVNAARDYAERMRHARETDAKFGEGHGRYEWESMKADHPESPTLAQFRDLAAKNGIDAEKVLSELGMPAKEHLTRSAAAREWDKPAVPATPPPTDPGQDLLDALKAPQPAALTRQPYEHVLDAIEHHGRGHNLANLVGVRKFLADRGLTTREQQDQAIDAARRAGLVSASAAEGRFQVTPEERAAAIHEPVHGRPGESDMLLYLVNKAKAEGRDWQAEKARKLGAPAAAPQLGARPEPPRSALPQKSATPLDNPIASGNNAGSGAAQGSAPTSSGATKMETTTAAAPTRHPGLAALYEFAETGVRNGGPGAERGQKALAALEAMPPADRDELAEYLASPGAGRSRVQKVAGRLAEGKPAIGLTPEQAKAAEEAARRQAAEAEKAAAAEKAAKLEGARDRAAQKHAAAFAALRGHGVHAEIVPGPAGKPQLRLGGATKAIREAIKEHGGVFSSRPYEHWIVEGDRKIAGLMKALTAEGEQGIAGMMARHNEGQAKEAEFHRNKVWANVPYEHRETAKRHGARWDAEKKQWFAPNAEARDRIHAEIEAAEKPKKEAAAAQARERAQAAETKAKGEREAFKAGIPGLVNRHGRTVRGEGKPMGYRTHLGHGRRAEIEPTARKVGEIIQRPDGPHMVVRADAPLFVSEDDIEDRDAWSEHKQGAGWYQSYEAVPVTPSEAEAGAMAAKAAAEQAQKRIGDISRQVEVSEHHSYTTPPNTAGMTEVKGFGHKLAAGSSRMMTDGSRIVIVRSSYDDGPSYWTLENPALAQELLALHRQLSGETPK